MPSISGPEYMVFPVTYRCNSRCIMCTVWRQKRPDELTIKEIKRLLSEPLLNFYLRRVSLTGGETTLRDDLPEIVDIIQKRCQNLYDIGIVTNGIDTSRVIRQSRDAFSVISKRGTILNILVSLDGIGEVHDSVRGVAGCFGNVEETIFALKKIFKDNANVNIIALTTIAQKNFDSMDEILEYSRRHDIPVTYTPAISTEIYTKSENMQDQFALSRDQRQEVIRFYKRLLGAGRVGYAYFRFITRWLKSGKRAADCPFKKRGFLLDVDGGVYPCGNYKSFYMGNIREESFTDIWMGSRVKEVRKNMKKKCRTCGTNCYVESPRISSCIPKGLKDFIKKSHIYLMGSASK